MKAGVFRKSIFPAALIIYCIAAFSGSGFFHADEHYQIIEFAWSKFEAYASTDYAWEFKEASRSGLQPAMAWLIFGFFRTFGLTNPYILAFILRLITALAALLVIRNFIKNTGRLFPDNFQTTYRLLSYFIWFLPLVNVRFSSEVWAGIALLQAVSLIFSSNAETSGSAFIIGICIGFSFLFRFQMGSVVFGLFLWLAIVRRPGMQKLAAYILGFGAVFLLGVCIDFWLYGRFVLSAWNYFDLQILQSVAAGFGETPWYDYFRILLFVPGWPVGAILLISVVWFLIRYPKSVVSWVIVSFLALHIFVGHKEERFLFPLANFTALLVVTFLSDLYSGSFRAKLSSAVRKRILFAAMLPFMVVNLIGLAAVLSKSAGSGNARIGSYIRKEYAGKQVKFIHTPYSSFYSPFESAPVKFYEEKNTRTVKIDGTWALHDSLLVAPDSIVLFAMRMNEHNDPANEAILRASRLKKIMQSTPEWILELNRRYYHQLDTSCIVELYRK